MTSRGRVSSNLLARIFAMGLLIVILWGFAMVEPASAQTDNQAGPSTEDVENGAPSKPDEAAKTPQAKSISFFSLILRGGWFMIPLGILSLVVVTLTIERLISLRREKIMPVELVTHLGNLGRTQGGFDPRSAYRITQQYPSSASNIIKALLLKVGRPQAEIETAVSDTSQRETDRLNAPVSWLSVIATVAPLIGLLGTVWGITQAFFNLANTPAGVEVNKAMTLADGIYTALVTTLCGLMIAIPAAIVAHFFESRIVKSINQINEMAATLMPQVEKYEGRLRFSDADAEPAPTTSRKRRSESTTTSETT